MKYKRIAFIFSTILFFSTLVLSGCLKEKPGISYKMPLEVWGVFDDSDAFAGINGEYANNNDQITNVKYRKISSNLAEYEKELFDAIASGNGPDVFFFHNTWLTQHENKIVPLPESSQYIIDYKNTFVDVAADDFIKNNQIYAMPLSNDTLALYYNKDLINQAGIASIPATWNEIENITPFLTKIDPFGNINQSAIALGRSKDPGAVNRSSDILMLMMMQNGAKIIDDRGLPMLDREQGARKALEFYTQFAQGGNKAYTWNSNMDYSIDSFRYGKTAMMLNYSYWNWRLKELDPKFNFGVAPAPQVDLNNKINFANYWGLAVVKSKQLKPERPDENINYTDQDRINEAWKYIQYVTAGAGKKDDFDPTKQYLELTKKPPARRDLVEEMKNDPELGVFAQQALTARSWRQPDNNVVETIFIDMIDEVVSGRSSVYDALKTASSRINALRK
jgi:multiple sugar transport system substrate-binding protein